MGNLNGIPNPVQQAANGQVGKSGGGLGGVPLGTQVMPTGSQIDAGVVRANQSSMGYGGMGGSEFGGYSPHPQVTDPRLAVHGEEVRGLGLLGLHGFELRRSAKVRFDSSDRAGTGHSSGEGPTPYTPPVALGDSNTAGGSALPYTMPGASGRRDEDPGPVRARSARSADVTNVAAALPGVKAARRGVKRTNI